VEKTIELRVSEGGQRLDKYVAQVVLDLSRSRVQTLIEEGLVTVNGAIVKSSYRVEVGDLVVVRVPPPEPVEVEPEVIPLDIVYENEDIIVVNKPAGMVVHPAYGHRTGTLVNAVLAHCPELAGAEDALRPGIVHRLDKDTSGLIIVAKNDSAQRYLQRQFKRREVKKVYVALLEGHLKPARGVIEAPIGRDKKRRQRMAVVEGGREARTEYRVMEYFGDASGKASRPYTLVEAEPRTGRTHQVRVHFASIGYPLAGDPVYGLRKQRLSLRRQFLHAQTLGFRLPVSDEYIEFTAELPDDLRMVLGELRRGSSEELRGTEGNSWELERERAEAMARLMGHAGAVNLGHPTGADNESIDVDLAREYGGRHEGET
jgi:23S rRNA pseudouridine1911/1915/1917 synthase